MSSFHSWLVTTALKVPGAVPDGLQGGAAAYAGDRGLDLADVPFVGPQNGDSGAYCCTLAGGREGEERGGGSRHVGTAFRLLFN